MAFPIVLNTNSIQLGYGISALEHSIKAIRAIIKSIDGFVGTTTNTIGAAFNRASLAFNGVEKYLRIGFAISDLVEDLFILILPDLEQYS